MYKSIVCVRALLGGVARYGIRPQTLFEGHNITPALLADGCARISLDEWQALVRRAISLTQDPGLGLATGGTVPEHVFQVVSPLAMSCATLRDAMDMFRRYQVLVENACLFDLIEEGELAYFVCTPLVPLPEAPYFDAELALSVVYRIARRFSAPGTDDAEELWMTYAKPAHADRYAQVFSCPVRFDRPKNAIVLARRYLDQPHAFADARTVEILKEHAERLLAEHAAPSLPERVRALLRQQSNLGQADLAQIAKTLRLHPRTLRRRLIQAKAPWSELLDEVRCQKACEGLRRRNVSLGELSERLGFSEPSAFSRAFKRWTGTTPRDYARSAAEAAAARPDAQTAADPAEPAS